MLKKSKFLLLISFMFFQLTETYASEKEKYFALQCYKMIKSTFHFDRNEKHEKLGDKYYYGKLRSTSGNDCPGFLDPSICKLKMKIKIDIILGWGEKTNEIRECLFKSSGEPVSVSNGK